MAQEVLRKKKKTGGNTIPNFRLYILQSNTNQNCMVLTESDTTEVLTQQQHTCRSMKQNRDLRNKTTHVKYDKEAKNI